ncbi:hypothetical protein, partial [Streptomyces sp. MUM 2J]
GGPAAPADVPYDTTTRLRSVAGTAGAPVPSRGADAPPQPPAPAGGTRRTPPTRTDTGPGHGTRPESAGQWSPPGPVAPPGPAGRPDPALSWNAPGPTRPTVSFGEPERFEEPRRAPRLRRRAAAAICLVLGLGLIGGAVTGSWLTGDSGDPGEDGTFSAAADLWHSVPVDDLFPPTVQGRGAGPGGADRTWTRIAVAPDTGCTGAFDPLLAKALAPVGCDRLLRATYADATRSHVTTVGLLFTTADATAMRTLRTRFDKEGLAGRTDLMPRPYAAKGTAAAGFGDRQRASWKVSVLTDAPVVVYAVSGWADGRTVDAPQPAEKATEPGATTAPGQAGLGNEAQGLANRIERSLRETVNSPTEKPS